ncbi:hypothetical protein Q3G72_027301 [Acer saccharum]|nr:hypothetical protein Q3G72_027301 [Acer saccharum]
MLQLTTANSETFIDRDLQMGLLSFLSVWGSFLVILFLLLVRYRLPLPLLLHCDFNNFKGSVLGRSPLAANRLLSFSPSRLHLLYFDRDLVVTGLWWFLDFSGLGGPLTRSWDGGGGGGSGFWCFWLLNLLVAMVEDVGFGFEYVVVVFGCEAVGDWVGWCSSGF